MTLVLALLSTQALAQAPDPCALLLAARPRITEAIAAVEAGADPDTRCTEHYTAHQRRTFTLARCCWA